MVFLLINLYGAYDFHLRFKHVCIMVKICRVQTPDTPRTFPSRPSRQDINTTWPAICMSRLGLYDIIVVVGLRGRRRRRHKLICNHIHPMGTQESII